MSTVISHPRAYATVTGHAATFVTPAGQSVRLDVAAGDDIRQLIVFHAARHAREYGAPVELVTAGDRGEHHLLVHPDGAFAPADTHAQPPASDTGRHTPRHGTHGKEVSEQAPQSDSPAHTPEPAVESPARPSFLTPAPTVHTRARGWRGALSSIGIRIRPSAAHRRRAEWTATVARQWAGCRTIAVVNGKGGVGKTMTCAMLAAVYAREGGGNVLAWDNNDTRGTLGWRTEPGQYDTTLRDLLPAAPTLLAPTAGVADIAGFVHHQQADRYDVLRSNPELLATDQRITATDFDQLMQVAARFYRLVVFDSGNDESADRWLRMIDYSYQLVIPTLATPESAESAALLLDALRGRDERGAALAAHAVVVVTQPEPSAVAARRIADGFAEHSRAVHIIPFDPALKAGPLRFDHLRARTRDAWLSVAASATETL
ncbi:ParA family protein [Microbacterium sp.]|uniref:ParA family protein n=1 Tax=Microbacterium sp. TaxID=51671 RepID=UPI0037C75BE2